MGCPHRKPPHLLDGVSAVIADRAAAVPTAAAVANGKTVAIAWGTLLREGLKASCRRAGRRVGCQSICISRIEADMPTCALVPEWTL